MKRIFRKTALSLLFVTIFSLFLLQPSKFMQCFFDGITVWAHNILPAIFPFALLSTLYLKSVKKPKFSLSQKLFGIDCDKQFLSSLLCGYPIGAKVISQCNANTKTTTAMCSFCSSASPVFIIATVGIALSNPTATIIVATSHLIATLLNGVLYCHGKKFITIQSNDNANNCTLQQTLIDCILSVLCVGGLVALFFMLTEMAQSLLPSFIKNTPALFFAIGLLEMTNGIMGICANCTLLSSTVLCSTLLSFGGLCIIAQCYAFVSLKGVSFGSLIKMKCTQAGIATIIAFVLGKIFL